SGPPFWGCPIFDPPAQRKNRGGHWLRNQRSPSREPAVNGGQHDLCEVQHWFRGFTMSPRFVAHMLSGHLAKLTKETLLNSPAFHRFAQESSSIAQKALNEAMRAAQPVVDKAASRSQQTLRQLERKANESLKNK
ncbi:unnamed protein product, partial [Effrenium voratum]